LRYVLVDWPTPRCSFFRKPIKPSLNVALAPSDGSCPKRCLFGESTF